MSAKLRIGVVGLGASRRRPGCRCWVLQTTGRCRRPGRRVRKRYVSAMHRRIPYADSLEQLAAQCDEQACTLHKRLHPYRRLQLRVNHRMNHSFSEHSAILDAIFAGDEQEAEALLKAHVVIQRGKIYGLISTLEHLNT